jgi:hypothetical protein
MSDLITEYTRKPALYEHLDGTADLGFGIFFLAWATSLRISQGSIAFLVASAVAGIVVHFGTRYIRRRLVYPRSGYLKPQKRPWMLAFVVLLSVAGSAGLSFWLAKPRSGPSPPLLFGLLMGLVMLIRAVIDRTRNRVILAIVSIAIGLALQFIEPRQAPGFFWYCLLMGIAFLLSGALTLRFYILRTPPRNLETE